MFSISPGRKTRSSGLMRVNATGWETGACLIAVYGSRTSGGKWRIMDSDWLNQLVGEIMREVQASEAKVHLPQLLDDVERGETVVITRHGRRIARIVPEVDRRQEEIDEALAGIRELRKRTGKIAVGELLSARDEGRKS
jgi:prevent-host-death family protein